MDPTESLADIVGWMSEESSGSAEVPWLSGSMTSIAISESGVQVNGL